MTVSDGPDTSDVVQIRVRKRDENNGLSGFVYTDVVCAGDCCAAKRWTDRPVQS